MIRTLIADDEPLARRGLRARLYQAGGFEIVAECANGRDTLGAIAEHAPGLLFLDIEMPGLNGFDVLQALPASERPVTVFVTAYDHYALDAFRAHALDYLLKPIDDDRFEYVVERIRRIGETERLQRRVDDLLGEIGRRKQAEAPFLVSENGRLVVIRTEEIDWIEAAGDYVVFHVGERTHLLRETMTNLLRRLPTDRFLRIHRSTIVRTDRISRLLPKPNGEHVIVLHDGTHLNQSRTYADAVRAWKGV
ncbi:MAG: LytTR family DNA-binding domain-containing protein [Bacteroidota bacterium]